MTVKHHLQGEKKLFKGRHCHNLHVSAALKRRLKTVHKQLKYFPNVARFLLWAAEMSLGKNGRFDSDIAFCGEGGMFPAEFRSSRFS